MNRFTTPEEIFGPVSIKELKEDRYIRQVEGYLPTADFAFLDEIWKSSPAILNGLLTIINEHIFKNGNDRLEVPLKSLIAASNEVPAENQGLDALYDRFIIRLVVPPIQENENFSRLLNSKPSPEKIQINQELIISQQELKQWREQLHDVQLSNDTMQIIQYIRQELADNFEELKIYVSDRRWQRAAILLKASAFCNDRKESNHSDAVLLKYCLWTTPENREKLEQVVMNAIQACGFDSGVNLANLDREKEKLDKEINKELYHAKDIYDTVTLGDKKEYFKVNAIFKSSWCANKKATIYIPFSQFKQTGDFRPVDENGNEIRHITCSFDGQGSCNIKYHDYDYDWCTFTAKALFKKGDKKNDINQRLILSLSESVRDIRIELTKVLDIVEKKNNTYKKQLNSPFVKEDEINAAVSGILEQIEQLKLRITDCERLESLCQ